jgi:tungstate transport system substrate-binding protein
MKNFTKGFLKTKPTALLVILMLFVAMFSACGAEKATGEVILATTTSVNDSGLLEYLKPLFEKDTGLTLKVIAQGSGQAMKTGENGDADVLFVHSKSAEEEFVTNGHGVKRIELMYNYFTIAGPADDPAGIKGIADGNAAAAFKKIMEKKSSFISRGDDSGTHKKELTIWKAAGIEPSGDWYISAGKGMGDVLMMADEKKAYTLTDKATFLSMKDKLSLEILLENAKDLFNQYTLIQVNPAKHANVNKRGAESFIKWMTKEDTLKKINEFGKDKYGEPLFTVNYK